MTKTKVEFAFKLSGQNPTESIKTALQGVGNVEFNETHDRVVVETESVPWSDIQLKLEDIGARAVLTGFGGKSCVSMIDTREKDRNIKGVIRFCAISDAEAGCVIDGVVDGLEANAKHKINVHECGDLSNGCESVGNIFNQSNKISKLISSDENGRISFRIKDEHLSVNDIIGRSVVVSKCENDQRLGCGIIARSAGIFENFKKICLCDGVTIWSERDKPIAGKARSMK